jgi:hypothetical protein
LVRIRGDECIDGNVGDVANIDKSGAARARWHEQAVIANNIISVGIAQVLSKKAWSNNSPSCWPTPQVLLDRVMRHDRVVCGTCDGDEYNLLHSRIPHDIEERIEGRASIGDGGRAKQEHGIAATHSAVKGTRFEEIEWNHIDAIQRANQIWLACADAKRDVTGAEATDDR